MGEDRDALLQQVEDLRTAAEAAGIVQADPWAALDTVWKGPDVDLAKIRVVGQGTMAAVHTAYADGRVEEAVILKSWTWPRRSSSSIGRTRPARSSTRPSTRIRPTRRRSP